MALESPSCRDDGGAVVHRTVHDKTGGSLSTSVLVALDSLPDFDAASSTETLFNRINPDALDSLFESSENTERSGWVVFPIDKYEVRVDATGEILIRERNSASD